MDTNAIRVSLTDTDIPVGTNTRTDITDTHITLTDLPLTNTLADNIELTFEVLFNMIDRITTAIGFGYQECIYRNALDYELRNYLFNVLPEQNIPVVYGLHKLGMVRADLVITNAKPSTDDRCIIEMRAVDKIKAKHVSQLERYMKASGIKKGFVINISYDNFEIREVNH